jgi:hypothetical protein
MNVLIPRLSCRSQTLGLVVVRDRLLPAAQSPLTDILSHSFERSTVSPRSQLSCSARLLNPSPQSFVSGCPLGESSHTRGAHFPYLPLFTLLSDVVDATGVLCSQRSGRGQRHRLAVLLPPPIEDRLQDVRRRFVTIITRVPTLTRLAFPAQTHLSRR